MQTQGLWSSSQFQSRQATLCLGYMKEKLQLESFLPQQKESLFKSAVSGQWT